jgi:hypothetical protein
LSQADDALARLDERLRASPLKDGWVARTDFAEAIAALWNQGELVYLEDLVLHDARMDIRAPTHELTRAHAMLRARRKATQTDPMTLLTYQGASELIGRRPIPNGGEGRGLAANRVTDVDSNNPSLNSAGPQMIKHMRLDLGWAEEVDDLFALQDALIAREEDSDFGTPPIADDEPGSKSVERALASARDFLDRLGKRPSLESDRTETDPLGLTPDINDESELFAEWRAVLDAVAYRPPLVSAALLMQAWHAIEPLPRQPWVGAILVGAALRQQGRLSSHLVALNVGLRAIRGATRFPVDLAGQLVRWLEAIGAAAREGLREHDRLVLAHQLLAHKLKGRRSTSKLPRLVDLLLAKPLITVPLIARELRVSPQAAQGLIAALGPSVRERTGRSRYRAWSI